MTTRREFLIKSAGLTLALSLPTFSFANVANRPLKATAITDVLGKGLTLTGIEISYEKPITEAVSANQFQVEGRTVVGVKTEQNRVILQLSSQDPTALLAQKPVRQKPASNDYTKQGPGKIGDKSSSPRVFSKAEATVKVGQETLKTEGVINRIVDDFKQLVFVDPKSQKTLHYNLFVPKNYDKNTAYPLVLFMHDASATHDNVFTTLYQGNGAIAWASPEFQAKHPCFVLAPQFDEIIVDDSSNTSAYKDAVLNLIQDELAKQYNIDANRRYTTGQSGGGMMSIAINSERPDFFAASYFVACQWNPAVVAPMAKNKIWITVSEDDAKAFPGQTAIVKVLEENGAKVARATWDAKWSDEQFQKAFDEVVAQNANVNFIAFKAGSVFEAGETNQGAAGHMNTWRYAYNIKPILDWVLQQKRG